MVRINQVRTHQLTLFAKKLTRGAETQKLAPKGLSAIANNNPILTEWFQVGNIRMNQMRTHLTLSEGSEYPIHQKYEVPSLTRARSKRAVCKSYVPNSHSHQESVGSQDTFSNSNEQNRRCSMGTKLYSIRHKSAGTTRSKCNVQSATPSLTDIK